MSAQVNVLAVMDRQIGSLRRAGVAEVGDFAEIVAARAAVAELIEAAGAIADTTPEAQRENWSCHKGITTAAKCGRCSRELRLSAALARVSGGAA